MIVLQALINTLGSWGFLLGSVGAAVFISYKSPERREFQLTYVLIITNLSLLLHVLDLVKK